MGLFVPARRSGGKAALKLSQVRLLVEDVPACFGFYRDVLGLETTFGDASHGYASFRAGDGTIAIFDRTEQGETAELRAPGDSALVVLEVDDVDACLARLGSPAVAGPVDRPQWGGRVAYLRDPDGNLLELFQTIPMSE
jgi:catechol 2,3-dioxygenase-like lactoylglutathione lyase family enzyme